MQLSASRSTRYGESEGPPVSLLIASRNTRYACKKPSSLSVASPHTAPQPVLAIPLLQALHHGTPELDRDLVSDESLKLDELSPRLDARFPLGSLCASASEGGLPLRVGGRPSIQPSNARSSLGTDHGSRLNVSFIGSAVIARPPRMNTGRVARVEDGDVRREGGTAGQPRNRDAMMLRWLSWRSWLPLRSLGWAVWLIKSPNGLGLAFGPENRLILPSALFLDVLQPHDYTNICAGICQNKIAPHCVPKAG